jgi:hypothetical protein
MFAAYGRRNLPQGGRVGQRALPDVRKLDSSDREVRVRKPFEGSALAKKCGNSVLGMFAQQLSWVFCKGFRRGDAVITHLCPEGVRHSSSSKPRVRSPCDEIAPVRRRTLNFVHNLCNVGATVSEIQQQYEISSVELMLSRGMPFPALCFPISFIAYDQFSLGLQKPSY